VLTTSLCYLVFHRYRPLYPIYALQTTEDCFNMDYRYPLSLLQAFAICIARYAR
jgi:hypothetical protein